MKKYSFSNVLLSFAGKCRLSNRDEELNAAQMGAEQQQ
jgi:hypothetical protein